MVQIIQIDRLEGPDLEIFSKLSEPELYHYREPDRGLFIAESPNVIDRALDAGYQPVSMLLDTKEITKNAAHIIERIGKLPGETIPVFTASEDVLRKLTGFPLTRGCLCAMERRELPSVQETIKDASRIAILEEVVNPTNVGAIFRSAAALGMDAVLLTHGCSDPLYRRAIRVSMGTVFQIPWARATREESEGVNLIRNLQSYGYKTVAMALTDDSTGIDNEEIRKSSKLAVIMGTEGMGLPKEVIAACDYRVMIPMHHGVDSLNVAAASAVAFWELMK